MAYETAVEAFAHEVAQRVHVKRGYSVDDDVRPVVIEMIAEVFHEWGVVPHKGGEMTCPVTGGAHDCTISPVCECGWEFREEEVARMNRTRLGAMLSLYRAANQWTVRDVAPQMGLSIATLSRIERGHAMDAATLLKVWTWMLAKTEGR